MAGRALAFSDAEIIRLGREEYIPVAADDWYQRRRQDAEGRFFVSVANQGPRKGEGGDTRQGIYCLTANGKLLAYKNVGQNPTAMRDLLQEGLREWHKLPESERRPGAIKVPEHGPVDATYFRSPPARGLILNVYARALDHGRAGTSNPASRDALAIVTPTSTAPGKFALSFTDAVCKVGRGDEASRDHLWVTEAEWKSLLPANARRGDTFPMPARIAERILRFHLVDNTRGEPPMWRRENIRTNQLTLHVEAATPQELRLRLEGAVLLATRADASQADRGYDASLFGYITYDPGSGTIRRFDMVSVGDHWGVGAHTRRDARPGRAPLGIAFELSTGDSPADRVAPQAAREVREYFGN